MLPIRAAVPVPTKSLLTPLVIAADKLFIASPPQSTLLESERLFGIGSLICPINISFVNAVLLWYPSDNNVAGSPNTNSLVGGLYSYC